MEVVKDLSNYLNIENENSEINTFIKSKYGNEYLSEHVENALNIELDYLNQKMASVPQDETFYIHCAGGYRSVIAASILKARGYHNIIDVAGGFSAIKETSISVSDYVCPTTL